MARDPIFDIFREEAREHLGALEKQFLDLETAPSDAARRELIDSLFRHAHSLKGDAKVVGLSELKEASQQLEDVLDELRAAPERVDRAAIDQGLARFDHLRSVLEAWQADDLVQSEVGTTIAVQDGLAAAMQCAAEPSPEVAAASRSEGVQTAPRPAAASSSQPTLAGPAEENFTVRVPSERLDRMLNLAGEVRISQSASSTIEARLAELNERLSSIPRPENAESSPPEEWMSTLTAWQSSLLDQFRRLESDVRKQSVREQRLLEALEGNIREARLLPFVMLTDMLRRAVRDLSQSLGKPIRYEADVGKIMLDKAVIEALKDPLVHLIRNAADHGIESPEQRRAAGKPQSAVVCIEARRHGELVRIRVADDGRGIDFPRIRQQLIDSGTLDAAAARQLPESELAKWLFEPGFTTAAAGTISGRGVGLDVVRNTAERLQGSVELESSSAAGAAFVITVPVTISTVRILTVLEGGHYYGIPSASLLRIGRVHPDALCELQGTLALPLGGQAVRWVQLADLVGTRATQTVTPQVRPYVLVAGHEGQIAVSVDELEDESEVLLKPLAYPLAGLPGMIGATIRADGSVQLVIDLSSSALGRMPAAQPSRPSTRLTSRRILVVDDSPTTRAVLRNVLTAAGYVVRTAVDGMDALERLRTHPVDLVVCDVEMPRLGGLDFTRQAKSKYPIPVILVTGKEKEEHRREGLQAGADAYVVKSTFAGEGLLDVIKQLI